MSTDFHKGVTGFHVQKSFNLEISPEQQPGFAVPARHRGHISMISCPGVQPGSTALFQRRGWSPKSASLNRLGRLILSSEHFRGGRKLYEKTDQIGSAYDL